MSKSEYTTPKEPKEHGGEVINSRRWVDTVGGRAIVRDSGIYVHPKEVWGEEKCRKVARSRWDKRFRGRIPYGYGVYRYVNPWVRINGNTVEEDVCYRGEYRPLPEVADGYEIKEITTGASEPCYILIKKGE